MQPNRYTRAAAYALASTFFLTTMGTSLAMACELDAEQRMRARLSTMIPEVSLAIERSPEQSTRQRERQLTAGPRHQSTNTRASENEWRLDLRWDVLDAYHAMLGRCPTGGAR